MSVQGSFGRRWWSNIPRAITHRRLVAAVVATVLVPLVSLLAPSPPAWAVTKTASGYLWGVDSVEPAAPNLATVEGDYGAEPAFWGRYVSDCGSLCGGNLTPTEISEDHGKGLNLLLLVADLTGSADQGSANGTADADTAVAAAHGDGVPAGVAIFKDFEAGSPVNAAYLESWFDTVAAAGYAPGFYENSYGAFAGAYCAAVSADPQIGKAYLYASENEPGPASSGPGSAPSFANAVFPDCPGGHSVWQYTEGDKGGVDEDLAAPTTPLWGPSGLVTFVPPGVPSLSIDPGSLNAAGGLLSIKATDADPVTSYSFSSSPSLSSLVSCSSSSCSVQIPANLSLNTIQYVISVVATGTGGDSAPAAITLSVYGLTQTVASQLPSSLAGPVNTLGSDTASLSGSVLGPGSALALLSG